MAGTTLRGIGDEEDEEEEGEKTPPPPTIEEPQQLSGPTVVDSAKVAESLKKLRSFEDFAKTPPPVVIPANAPVSGATLLGVPLTLPAKAVPAPGIGTHTLFGIGAPIPAVEPGSGPTAPTTGSTQSGVVAPVDTEADATIPTNAVSGIIERDIHGTVLGHDLHLAEQERPADGRGRVITERGLNSEFSGGERRFFESEPLIAEFEPEYKPNPYTRVGVGLAVLGVFVAAVWGYVRYRSFEPAATEAESTTTPAATPTPAEPPPAGTAMPAPARGAPPVTALEAPAPPARPPTTLPAQESPAPAPSRPTPNAAVATPAPETVRGPSEEPTAPPAMIETQPPAKPKRPAKQAETASRTGAGALKDADKPRVYPPGRPLTSLEPIRPAPTAKPAVAGPHETPSAAAGQKSLRLGPFVAPGAPHPLPKTIKPSRRGGEDDPDGTLPLSVD